MNFVIGADLVILLLVFTLPLISHRVERNLEAFLFVMGVLAALAADVLNAHLIEEAIVDPVPITLAVLLAGLLFKWGRAHIGRALVRLRTAVPMRVLVAVIVAVLGLVSSVITAIIASLVLVELISIMRFRVEDESRLVVVACMAIGLGAALTPLGEPLSTIAVAKLNADFWYLGRLLGPWIVPAILALAVWSGMGSLSYKGETLTEEDSQETYRGVVVRAARVFVFVMALVLLGEGFRPIIDRFVIGLDARLLYWINTVSAVLDNATLTAAEISPRMRAEQIRAVLMGLLISGGMLIPGNIPNIIAAGKLQIRSRTWARYGVPLGLVLLIVYFVLLFLV